VSELAVAAILVRQPGDAGAFRPVALGSRTLTRPERPHPPASTGAAGGGRVKGLMADVLRSFAGERADHHRPDLVPPVEFAASGSASPLGSGRTPLYADRGQRPAAPSSRRRRRTRPDPARPSRP
jgi:hypothetical protein